MPMSSAQSPLMADHATKKTRSALKAGWREKIRRPLD